MSERGAGGRVTNARAMSVYVLALMIFACAIGNAIAQPPAGGGEPPMAAPGMVPPGRGGPPPGPRGLSPELLEQLGLTDAQRAKIDALHDDAMRTAIATDAAARIAELDLDRMIEVVPADTVALARQVDQVAGLRAQLLATRVRTEVAVRAVLTPPQRAKLKSLQAQRGPGMHP